VASAGDDEGGVDHPLGEKREERREEERKKEKRDGGRSRWRFKFQLSRAKRPGTTQSHRLLWHDRRLGGAR
jgi:hypothetical protein